ncbi:hypothetical protein [Pseudogemmobacter humi]|uniref:Uncharacterized protein n=1 Tax=Pseudogemmobacter humi TaxID=2483812 RepID=A0A3P5XAG5_9RHOB|nr:hypothetical protein [Pseudogemmobacter humi]VDC28261.1 hypothetical protein XINFAN_02036 [Pseudogemmobacter humi]
MAENPSINRYLRNKAMDHIDHALGRPFDPMRETYRNYFATDCPRRIEAFQASGHWDDCGAFTGMRYFSVNDAGRAALRDHLRTIRDPHRAWTVSLIGFEMTIIARSRGKAFYEAFLRASDSLELDFRDFCGLARIRRAA